MANILAVLTIMCFTMVKTMEAKIEVPRFISSPKSCHGSSVPLLILVHSAADHFELRTTLRKTWTQAHPDFRRVFVVGQSLDKEQQLRAQQEIETEKDILFIETFESYRNLTYKHIAAYEWAINECPEAGMFDYPFSLFAFYFVTISYISLRKNSPGGKNIYLQL